LPAVVFYISGHGFGHASRQVEVINVLGTTRPDLSIVIRSAVDPGLLRRTLKVPYTLLPGESDTGVIQSSSLAHDDAATVRAAIAFHETLPARADAERAALPPDTVTVVADIPPLACEVAERAGVPALAIGNFTWDWIYEWYAEFATAAPWLVPAIRSAYRKARLALELPFAGGFEVFPAVERIPLIARHPTRSRFDTRRRFGIWPDRPAALLSFGGYGLPALRLASLDCLSEWTIVTTDRSAELQPDLPASVVMLPEREFVETGFRYEDVVAAVDVVITKPGYGITAECITGGTAMLYTSRGHFREYDLLVREIPRYLRARFISQDDLLGGRIRDSLDALLAQPQPSETMATNGAQVAAGFIIEAMRQ
jgi:L-arabinokinase